jgi:hypothetical protein
MVVATVTVAMAVKVGGPTMMDKLACSFIVSEDPLPPVDVTGAIVELKDCPECGHSVVAVAEAVSVCDTLNEGDRLGDTVLVPDTVPAPDTVPVPDTVPDNVLVPDTEVIPVFEPKEEVPLEMVCVTKVVALRRWSETQLTRPTSCRPVDTGVPPPPVIITRLQVDMDSCPSQRLASHSQIRASWST